jgi:hypothetical protein
VAKLRLEPPDPEGPEAQLPPIRSSIGEAEETQGVGVQLLQKPQLDRVEDRLSHLERLQAGEFKPAVNTVVLQKRTGARGEAGRALLMRPLRAVG